MAFLGKKITESQNSGESITLIASQKQLYSTAKYWFYVQCVIVTLIPVIISIIQVLIPNRVLNFTWIFTLYTILAFCFEVIADKTINNFKKTAASIQELFDSTVLEIRWNKVLSEKPQPEIIHAYYEKYLKKSSTKNLYDWYSVEIKEVDTNLATVICQRTNCVYDFSIRKKYNSALGVTSGIIFLILLILSCLTGLTVVSFLTNVLLPSIPVFVLAVNQYTSNNDSIVNLKSLRELIERTLAEAKINSVIDETIIRQIQDKIYNNRALSPLLPDWVFYKFRNKLESQMHFGVKQTIADIRSRT